LPPQGYSGLENLVYTWACEFAKMGHQVSVIAPEGSQFPPELNIKLVPVPLRTGEDTAYETYRERLTSGEYDVIIDHSWLWFSVLAQMEADRQLPIVHCYHSDPYNLGSPPPIEKPCILAFSEAQANIIRQKWNVACRVAYHGIDLDFYKPDPNIERGDRYLFLARYTPEKGFLELAQLARKCRVPLDAFGDTEIVSNREYVRKCLLEADGRGVRVNTGISRAEAVKQFQSHKALLTWPNYVEIFGLTTIESMALGTPVISKDSGAARELIIHGKTGFVVGTIEEAEEIIKKNLVSQIDPQDCIDRAAKFSIRNSAEAHIKVLEDAANKLYW
jgi:glycosyltransferase involved in cell wall biosynthesis